MTMTDGKWIRMVPLDPHNCRMPGTDGNGPGALWQCECGRIYELTEDRLGFRRVDKKGV